MAGVASGVVMTGILLADGSCGGLAAAVVPAFPDPGRSRATGSGATGISGSSVWSTSPDRMIARSSASIAGSVSSGW